MSTVVRFAVCVASIGGLVALQAGSARDVPAADLRSSYAPPLASPIDPFLAVNLFDRPDTPYGPGHRGIDIDAAIGQVVVSPADGTVTFAGVVVDRGVVSVAHADGLVSSVEPIAPNVAAGDLVSAGQVLGIVSSDRGHCAPSTCLHWGVRRGGSYTNPLDVLRGFGPVRLLPLEDVAARSGSASQSNAPVERSTSRSFATAPV